MEKVYHKRTDFCYEQLEVVKNYLHRCTVGLFVGHWQRVVFKRAGVSQENSNGYFWQAIVNEIVEKGTYSVATLAEIVHVEKAWLEALTQQPSFSMPLTAGEALLHVHYLARKDLYRQGVRS